VAFLRTSPLENKGIGSLVFPSKFWRYRLTVRTEPSQGLNTRSIPVSATESFIIRYLQTERPRYT
jgi:hypothetical protein